MSTSPIDPRSFRAFEIAGDRLFFDRAKAATFEIDNTLFATLSLVGAGIPLDEAARASCTEGHEVSEDVVVDTIEQLSEQGFFTYTPVDHREQEGLMESLWRHKPRRLQMLMAQGCNLGCRYCYAWRNGSNQKGTLMPFEIARRSVDYLVKKSGGRRDLQITFFGGEPLLNYPVIRQVVEYCRELEKTTDKSFVFELITNGVLLDKEVVDWIVSEKFILFVSLDGWKEMHNYNRPSLDGDDDVYDLILEHALYANEQLTKHKGVPMKVRANLTKKHHDWRAVGEYLASLGFKVIGVGAIEPLSHGEPSPSSLTEEQANELHETVNHLLIEAVEKLINGEEITYFESVQLRKMLGLLVPRKLKGITCGVNRNTQIVDNKGNLFPCHRYEGMENYIVGDVFTGHDREKTMDYYRKLNGNATARCHSCWVRDYCGGGCAWLLSKKDGHLADPTEQECDRRRSSVELALWLRQKMRTHFPERFNKDGEVDLDAWNWGPADAFNEAYLTEEGAAAGAESGSCGDSESCETCGPTSCAD